MQCQLVLRDLQTWCGIILFVQWNKRGGPRVWVLTATSPCPWCHVQMHAMSVLLRYGQDSGWGSAQLFSRILRNMDILGSQPCQCSEGVLPGVCVQFWAVWVKQLGCTTEVWWVLGRSWRGVRNKFVQCVGISVTCAIVLLPYILASNDVLRMQLIALW